jgi:hypothetical protein
MFIEVTIEVTIEVSDSGELLPGTGFFFLAAKWRD